MTDGAPRIGIVTVSDRASRGLYTDESGPAIEAALRDYAALLGAIERHPRPVIALVDGAALGGGVGVAAAADLVLATARASFALPEVLVGLIPAVVLPVLARRIGWSHARSLALGRIPLSADAALRLGLIDEISDDLDRTQRRHASRFARMSPDALAAVKELSAAEFASREEYTREATRRFAELLATPSTRNRLRRFAAGDAPWPEAPDAIDKEKQ